MNLTYWADYAWADGSWNAAAWGGAAAAVVGARYGAGGSSRRRKKRARPRYWSEQDEIQEQPALVIASEPVIQVATPVRPEMNFTKALYEEEAVKAKHRRMHQVGTAALAVSLVIDDE